MSFKNLDITEENALKNYKFVENIWKEYDCYINSHDLLHLNRVSKFRDLNTNQFCIIKKLPKRAYTNYELERTKNVMTYLKQFKTPFFVEYLAMIETPVCIYIVTQFLPKGTLKDQLQIFNPMDEKKVNFYAACILLAMEFMHLKNVVHGDLNIHNVALDEKGYAKIIDFDSSRIVSSLFPDLFKDHHGLADIMEDCAIGETFEHNRDLSRLQTLSRPLKSVIIQLRNSHKDYNNLDCRMCLAHVQNSDFFANFEWQLLREGKLIAPQDAITCH